MFTAASCGSCVYSGIMRLQKNITEDTRRMVMLWKEFVAHSTHCDDVTRMSGASFNFCS